MKKAKQLTESDLKPRSRELVKEADGMAHAIISAFGVAISEPCLVILCLGRLLQTIGNLGAEEGEEEQSAFAVRSKRLGEKLAEFMNGLEMSPTEAIYGMGGILMGTGISLAEDLPEEDEDKKAKELGDLLKRVFGEGENHEGRRLN